MLIYFYQIPGLSLVLCIDLSTTEIGDALDSHDNTILPHFNSPEFYTHLFNLHPEYLFVKYHRPPGGRCGKSKPLPPQTR